jgi:hypothetical protein
MTVLGNMRKPVTKPRSTITNGIARERTHQRRERGGSLIRSSAWGLVTPSPHDVSVSLTDKRM